MRGGWDGEGAVNIPERQTLSCRNSWEDLCTCQNIIMNPGFYKVTLQQVGRGPGSEGLSFGEKISAGP